MMRRFRGLFLSNSCSGRTYLCIGWFVMDPVSGGSCWGPSLASRRHGLIISRRSVPFSHRTLLVAGIACALKGIILEELSSPYGFSVGLTLGLVACGNPPKITS